MSSIAQLGLSEPIVAKSQTPDLHGYYAMKDGVPYLIRADLNISEWTSLQEDINSGAVTPVVNDPNAGALGRAQHLQIDLLRAAYQAVISQNVNFTTVAGVTNSYQTTQLSIASLNLVIAGCSSSESVPSDFYWVAADNTRVPFTYTDLRGLSSAILSQQWTAFQNLQTKKAAVNAATTIEEVRSITF